MFNVFVANAQVPLQFPMIIFANAQDTLPVLVFSLPAVCYCHLSPVYVSGPLTKCHFGDQTKKTEMSGACSTSGEREEMYTGIWWGNLRERIYLQDLGVDGSIILKFTFKKWVRVGEIWIDLEQDRGMFLAKYIIH